MVPPVGLEPTSAAYLALTGYKSAALTIELRGRDRCDHAGIRKTIWALQLIWRSLTQCAGMAIALSCFSR